MITEKDLQEAIAECEGQRNPNASTCAKLAAFYTIKDHMFPSTPIVTKGYSYAPAPTFSSKTEFGDLISDLDTGEIFQIMDELMTALSVLNPKLYNKVLEKLDHAHQTQDHLNVP